MTQGEIRFDDGAAYERFMGGWSQVAGDVFLEWLAPPAGLRWLDVGCGNGAFTQRIVERCAPRAVLGVDPFEGQIAHARGRLPSSTVELRVGDAMSLPCADQAFDVAVMALVIFFVPQPMQGVDEMKRAVRPGGTIAAYAWDMPGGGFPYAALQAEMRDLGKPLPTPPSADASRLSVLHDLWTGAGIEQVETREIVLQRTFDDFDAYWRIALDGPGVAARLAEMPADDVGRLQAAVRDRLSASGQAPFTCRARANAVKGRVPGPVNAG